MHLLNVSAYPKYGLWVVTSSLHGIPTFKKKMSKYSVGLMHSPQCVTLAHVVSNLGDGKNCLQQCVNLTPKCSCRLV